MPNIPCVVGAGASGYAGGAHATAKDMEMVGLVLNSFGIALPVEEKYLDAVTGLSGSGPAYVFLFLLSRWPMAAFKWVYPGMWPSNWRCRRYTVPRGWHSKAESISAS